MSALGAEQAYASELGAVRVQLTALRNERQSLQTQIQGKREALNKAMESRVQLAASMNEMRTGFVRKESSFPRSRVLARMCSHLGSEISKLNQSQDAELQGHIDRMQRELAGDEARLQGLDQQIGNLEARESQLRVLLAAARAEVTK